MLKVETNASMKKVKGILLDLLCADVGFVRI